METPVEEEPLSTQNSKVEMPEIDQDSQKVDQGSGSSMENQPIQKCKGNKEEKENKEKFTIKPYLDRIWTDTYAYELYTVELNKIAWEFNMENEKMIDLAYKWTADLDTIES